MMIKFLSILLLTDFLFLLTNCKHGTDPPKEEPFCQISDSTGHNFSWRVDTLGLWPSVLHDVDAVDENNVWAVGGIMTADSDTVWHNPDTRNNAVKWNGKEFEYYQLPVISGGGTVYPQDLVVALTFSGNDIWFFSDAGSYVHWNGTTWESAFIPQHRGMFRAGWGSSGDNFYIVGNNGSITRYDGQGFTLMDAGTDKDLHDVTGYVDPETGLTNLWVASEEILLHYDGKTWTTVWDRDHALLPGYFSLGAIYAPDEKHVIVLPWIYPKAYGFCISTKDTSQHKTLFNTEVSGLVMDGMAINDIFIGGKLNRISHYNGNSVMEYPEIESYGNSHGIVYKNNHVFMVSSAGQRGIFIHGTRNE